MPLVIQVVLQHLKDLGITVIYAMIAGVLIAVIIGSDSGSTSLRSELICASLLPCFVFALIVADAFICALTEH